MLLLLLLHVQLTKSISKGFSSPRRNVIELFSKSIFHVIPFDVQYCHCLVRRSFFFRSVLWWIAIIWPIYCRSMKLFNGFHRAIVELTILMWFFLWLDLLHTVLYILDDQLRMLQEMGLDRDACTEYLASAGSSGSAENDDIRLTPNYLHHHVQSSEYSFICTVAFWSLLTTTTLHNSSPSLLQQ